MSAEVEMYAVYNAYCADCANGAGPYEDEDEAADWAANHNAESHEPDDRADADYENWKESRHEP